MVHASVVKEVGSDECRPVRPHKRPPWCRHWATSEAGRAASSCPMRIRAFHVFSAVRGEDVMQATITRRTGLEPLPARTATDSSILPKDVRCETSCLTIWT